MNDQRQSFNLSSWALEHRSLVLYFMLVLTLAGMLAYTKLGQSEDQPFTFKVMVVRTMWPGASTPKWSSRSPTNSKRSCRSCHTSISCAVTHALGNP